METNNPISRDDIRVVKAYLNGDTQKIKEIADQIEIFYSDNSIYGTWHGKKLPEVPISNIVFSKENPRTAYHTSYFEQLNWTDLLEQLTRMVLNELGEFKHYDGLKCFGTFNGCTFLVLTPTTENTYFKKIIKWMEKDYIGSQHNSNTPEDPEKMKIAKESAEKAEKLLYVATILAMEVQKGNKNFDEYVRDFFTLAQTANFKSDDLSILKSTTALTSLLDTEALTTARKLWGIDMAFVWQEIVAGEQGKQDTVLGAQEEEASETETEKDSKQQQSKEQLAGGILDPALDESADQSHREIVQHFQQLTGESEIDYEDILIRAQIETANIINQLLWTIKRNEPLIETEIEQQQSTTQKRS